MTGSRRKKESEGRPDADPEKSSRLDSRDESERKILYLTTNDITEPARGCDRRSYQIKRWLSNWHRVWSISYVKDTEAGTTDSNCEYALRYPGSKLAVPFDPRVLLRMLRLRTRHRFDWVVASGLGSFFYGVLAKLVFDAHLVVDLHNVEHVLSKEIGYVDRYLFAKSIGSVAVSMADVVVFTSKEDRSQYPIRIRKKSVIVSNGYDTRTFSPSVGAEKRNVLFFGNMEYPPNKEAVEYISRELAPKIEKIAQGTEILLAGPHCEEITDVVSDRSSVKVVGLVDEIAEYIRNSQVVVVPLLRGSGTRLKVIESLACGTKVISTPKGAEGWPSRWENLVIAESDEFADRVLSVLDSSADFAHDELEEYARFSWREQVKTISDEMSEVEGDRKEDRNT